MEIKKKLLSFAGFSLMMVLTASISQAETMYVTDVLKLIVRSEKGYDQNLLTVIKSGQVVEVLQKDGDWVRVRLSDGREGWVLGRYLISDETNNLKLENLQKKHKVLSGQIAALLEENTTLNTANKKLLSEFDQMAKTVKEVSTSYENLKIEAADYLALKAKYARTNTQLAEKTQLEKKLKEEIERLETRQTIRWFMSGAGVLFLGFIIGFSAKRQRRRSSLLS
jgi:SH3 domain protein